LRGIVRRVGSCRSRATRAQAIRFLIAFSGPTVTADEVDLFQNLTGEGERHAETLEEAERQTLARGSGGVDPIPWLRALRIPSGSTASSTSTPGPASARVLYSLPGTPSGERTVVVLPKANHALVETTTGLTSEMLRSARLATDLIPTLRGWIERHGRRGKAFDGRRGDAPGGRVW
jgi:hypothetical protein